MNTNGEKTVHYNGVRFIRDDKTGYYLNSTIQKRLHRYVYECEIGEIPRGYHIHHIDHDKNNNNIENLVLICPSAHASYHGKMRAETHYDEMIENLNVNARPKASEWHRSEEGRKWHSEMSIETWKKRTYEAYECQNCSNTYKTKDRGNHKFCSNACKSAWRRKSGVDDEERQCAECGEKFTVNKYYKKIGCTRKCTYKYNARIRQSEVS